MSNIDQPSDDSLAYARSLEKAAAAEAAAESESPQGLNDPLAAVKNMRLQQLAACRIKTAKELKNNMDKSSKASPA